MSTRAPRMHTAEHCLNQAMVRLVGTGRCFSAHVNPKKSKCDYHFDRPLSEDEAQAVVDMVNGVLTAGLPVSAEDMPLAEAGREFDLSRLPDPQVETVRIVRVGDFDACPCSGEHVANTAEVGAMRLVSHSFEDGVLRIRFKLDRPDEQNVEKLP